MEMVIKFKNWILEFATIVSFSLMGTSIFCSHPLTLCLTLILLAISVASLSGLIFMKWIFYAVILIFLGGMMVVFIYVTTLAGNEKFTLKLTGHHLMIFIFSVSILYLHMIDRSQFKKEIFMSHIYFSSATSLLWFLVIFLFSVLIVVIKLAENFKGALIKFL